MLVISKTSLQLMSVCLVLYTSPAAFASPVDFTPTRTLQRRRPKVGNLCNPPETWTQRQCIPERGPIQWQDICKGRHTTAHPGICLIGEVCQADIDEDGDRTIKCVPTLGPNEINPRLYTTDPQIGTSESKQAITSLDPTEFTHDVAVVDDLGLSTISAVILSEYLHSTCYKFCEQLVP